MRRLLRGLPALALIGCASGGTEPAPVRPQVPAEAEQAPAELVSPEEPEPQPATKPVLPEDLEALCTEVLEYHRAGDHKQAVDLMKLQHDRELSCPPPVEAAFVASRDTLRAADDLIRAGLEHRDRGEIDAARTSFEQALELYPKYHWVRALEQTLSGEESEAVSELLEQAVELRSRGEIDEALEVLGQAHRLAPDEPEVAELLSETKTQVAFRFLASARQALAEGRLEDAIESVTRAIEARPDVEQARARVVEDARSLGLRLFSAGELHQARSLWLAALELDETNPTLLEYLAEVDARLESLSAIQNDDDG